MHTTVEQDISPMELMRGSDTGSHELEDIKDIKVIDATGNSPV